MTYRQNLDDADLDPLWCYTPLLLCIPIGIVTQLYGGRCGAFHDVGKPPPIAWPVDLVIAIGFFQIALIFYLLYRARGWRLGAFIIMGPQFVFIVVCNACAQMELHGAWL